MRIRVSRGITVYLFLYFRFTRRDYSPSYNTISSHPIINISMWKYFRITNTSPAVANLSSKIFAVAASAFEKCLQQICVYTKFPSKNYLFVKLAFRIFTVARKIVSFNPKYDHSVRKFHYGHEFYSSSNKLPKMYGLLSPPELAVHHWKL